MNVTESGKTEVGGRDGCGNLGHLHLGTFTGRSQDSTWRVFKFMESKKSGKIGYAYF